MGNLAHYSVVEIGDSNEVINVGVFTNVVSDGSGKFNEDLTKKITEALCNHFDCDEEDISFELHSYDEVFDVNVLGCDSKCSISETWIY